MDLVTRLITNRALGSSNSKDRISIRGSQSTLGFDRPSRRVFFFATNARRRVTGIISFGRDSARDAPLAQLGICKNRGTNGGGRPPPLSSQSQLNTILRGLRGPVMAQKESKLKSPSWQNDRWYRPDVRRRESDGERHKRETGERERERERWDERNGTRRMKREKRRNSLSSISPDVRKLFLSVPQRDLRERTKTQREVSRELMIAPLRSRFLSLISLILSICWRWGSDLCTEQR